MGPGNVREWLDKGRDGRHLMASGSDDRGPTLCDNVTKYGTILSTVKGRKSAKPGPVAERLAILLDVFSPWDDISLTYRQFAAELGAPVSEAAVKKWPQRKKFPADIARVIVKKAHDRGISAVTLEWVLWGEGTGPHKSLGTAPHPRRSSERRSPASAPTPPASADPHGQFAVRIGAAIQADLGHNEFGQWSSVEVQHTVLWALKDLARRLRVLRFDMGKTFELTDEWAGKIGLPVRPQNGSADEEDAEM